MKYKTTKNESLYSVAAKLFPNKVIYGIYKINSLNKLYEDKDTFLFEKLMDQPLGEMELTI